MTRRRVWIAWSVLLISGCGGKVVVDDTENDLAGSDCVAACAAQFPGGVDLFLLVGGGCLCEGCDDACTESVCHSHELPSDRCLPCVKAGFLGDHCQNHDGLFLGCTHDTGTECASLAQCIVACPNRG